MHSETNTITRLYQNHGKAIGYWEGWVESDGWVFVRYAKTLDGKPVEKRYQAAPKNVGRANETTAYEQGVLELASKARLKMDKGYVKTLDEARAPSTNTLGLLKPMLATPMDKIKPEKIDWVSAFAQPKLDGHRAMFKDGVLYTRQGKELHMPHITTAIEDAGLGHLHLDGELYIHGMSLQEIGSLIKKYRPESVCVEYHVYDMVSPLPFPQRIMNLLHEGFPKFPTVTPLKPVQTVEVLSLEDAMALHARYRDEGYEGTMLRFSDDGYQDGKRSRTLLKIKEFQDEEFRIVGYSQGKPYITANGDYQVPVWICETVDGKQFTVTAAGTMEEKDYQWRNREAYVRRMLTVKFHYYSSEGIPQLPVALRFREDI